MLLLLLQILIGVPFQKGYDMAEQQGQYSPNTLRIFFSSPNAAY